MPETTRVAHHCRNTPSRKTGHCKKRKDGTLKRMHKVTGKTKVKSHPRGYPTNYIKSRGK